MDKLIETPWFMKVIALSLAALLYISVNFTASKEDVFNTPSYKDDEVIDNVPVEVYYDRDNLVVTGMPETVTVKLHGPKNLIVPASTQRDFKVYVDLSDPEIELGTRKVTLKIKDLNDKITYTIDPESVEVSIQEKVTKEFTVEPEYDRSLLADGYIAEEPKIKPAKVKITGAKDVVGKIAYVKAIINIKANANANDTFYREVQVQALDKDLNKLDVAINPNVVEVEVPIKIPKKTVKIEAVSTGEPLKDIAIKDISTDPQEITISGKKSILDSIESVKIPVDISKVDKNMEFSVPVELPEGIKASSVQEVRVKVSITPKGEDNKDNNEGEQNPDEDQPAAGDATITKTFSNLTIVPSGLEEAYNLAFISPSQGHVNVTVSGKQSDINRLNMADIQVSAPLDGLQEGEHTVSLKLETPANIDGKLSVSSAKVSLTKKEDGNQ